jgi:hypothetical protein
MLHKQATLAVSAKQRATDSFNANALAFLVDPVFNDRDRDNDIPQNKTNNSSKTTQKPIADNPALSLITDRATGYSDRSISGKRSKSCSNTLEIIDASTSDTLFNLGTSSLGTTGTASIGASGTASKSTLATYKSYDPIDYGNPFNDSYYWRYQTGSSSCAIVAQVSVYESLTGTWISETDASNYAQSQGWFNPQTGTPIPDTGNLLNALGVATYGGYNSTLNGLASALQRGDKPIVSLDANEIWFARRSRSGKPVELQDLGHAAWVTGIDVKPNGSIKIILNDSGVVTGKSEIVNYKDFYNAWKDYGFFSAIADNPFT